MTTNLTTNLPGQALNTVDSEWPTVNYIESINYAYDANGNLLLQQHERDADGDGNLDYVDTLTYAYDANGNLTLDSYQKDEDGDGEVDYDET